jgi:uncharacterized protein (DUF486 family)
VVRHIVNNPSLLFIGSGAVMAGDWLGLLEPALEILLLVIGVGIAIVTFLVKIEELRTKKLSRMKVVAEIEEVVDNKVHADLKVQEVEYDGEADNEPRD